jgi:ABC-2 type transport system permease protein
MGRLHSPAAVPARLAFRAARRSAAVWAVVFGFTVVGSAQGFVAAYPTTADRQKLAASLGSSAGARALLGVPHRIDTVAGFTAWRSVGVLLIVGAVWGVLVSTRALRGEEDAGRAGLVRAGPVTARGATASGLGGLALGLAVLIVVTAATGPFAAKWIRFPSYLGLCVALAAAPAVAIATGALASQLAGTRRQAASLAGGVVGAWYLLRLIADSSSSTGWLRWLTPLGWVEELRPLTGFRPLVLVPLVALVAVLCGAAIVVAGRRDEGSGILAARDTAEPRTRLLTGPLGLATRLAGAGTVAWSLAMATAGFVSGLVARAAAEATSSGAAGDILARLGIRRSGAEAYLGVTFLVVAAVAALVAAGQAVAAREEEASARLDHLLVRPVGRRRWLCGRALVGAAEVAVVALATGVAAWAGTAVEGHAVPLGRSLLAGVNVVPAALFVLGVGLLLFGSAPRLVAAGAYGLVAWSFVLQLIASLLDAPSWLLDLSLFHHVALAPAVDPDWTSAVALVLLGALAGVAGAMFFERRDIVAA